MAEDDRRSADTARLDAFVDAAFAFAVGLLVVTSGSPDSLDDLRSLLWASPAFAFSFALLMIFWAAHRHYGRMAPRRDGTSFVLSLAVVFAVLMFVYPLRLLSQAMVRFLSGGTIVSGPTLTRWNDLELLYVVYGLFFAVLAGLTAALFLHAVRAADRVGLTDKPAAREQAGRWAVIGAVGGVSAATALLIPLSTAPWLPGAVYWLIPILMGLWRLVFRPPPPAAPA